MLPVPELIAAARRQQSVDLLVRSARLVNVLSGEIHPAHITVRDGVVIASLPLPIAGLMSDAPAAEVQNGLQVINDALGRLGYTLANPFAALSFLALPVIPALKLTDRGLVDVARFEIVPLWDAG